jgi:hypothetical protein
MCKYLVTIMGLVVISGLLLASGRAEAGSSISAPTKYSAQTNRAANVYPMRTYRQVRRPDFGITEYSSSSARSPSRGHAYR